MKNLNWKIAEKDFFKKNNTNQYKLDNILEALQYLGNPHKQLEEKVIHISEIDDRLAAHIRSVLADAVAKSLVERAVKDIYGSNG